MRGNFTRVFLLTRLDVRRSEATWYKCKEHVDNAKQNIIYRRNARQYLNLLHLAAHKVPASPLSLILGLSIRDTTPSEPVMPVLTSGQTRFDDAIIRTEMRSVLSLATTLDEISVLIYDGLQFGNAKLLNCQPPRQE